MLNNFTIHQFLPYSLSLIEYNFDIQNNLFITLCYFMQLHISDIQIKNI